MERTPNFIKVWFWSRHASNVPSDVLNGSGSINTDAWGTPTAYFPNTQCNIDSHFTPSNIIINLTFCELALVQRCLSSFRGGKITSNDFSVVRITQVETGPALSTVPLVAPGPAKVCYDTTTLCAAWKP